MTTQRNESDYKKDFVERAFDKAFERASSNTIGIAVLDFFNIGLQMEERKFEALNAAVRQSTGLRLAFRSKVSDCGKTYLNGVGLVAPDGTSLQAVGEAGQMIATEIDNDWESIADMVTDQSAPKASLAPA